MDRYVYWKQINIGFMVAILVPCYLIFSSLFLSGEVLSAQESGVKEWSSGTKRQTVAYFQNEEKRPVEVITSGTVKLNFPNEIELKTLADFVSERLNLSHQQRDDQAAGATTAVGLCF